MNLIIPTYISLKQNLRSTLQQSKNQQLMRAQTLPFFQEGLNWLLDCDDAWLAQTFKDYQNCSEAWIRLSGLKSSSSKTDGFAKSLDVAEGFAIWALVAAKKPKVIVELGVQHGLSSRLWKEALNKYVPNHQLYLCDLEDKRRFIDDSESVFLKGDAYQLLPELYASQTIDLLHNDAHPYSLIDWSVREGIKHNIPIFTFHDVNGTPPRKTFIKDYVSINKDEKLENDLNLGKYGHWERHVMGEQFDNRIWDSCSAENSQFKVYVFESLFGFGVALNKSDAAD
jgi:hypothetical protein